MRINHMAFPKPTEDQLAVSSHYLSILNSKPNFSGCGTTPEMLRSALDDGAAFAEVTAKYAGVENPTWTLDADSMIGDWRRAVETRTDVLKNCVSTSFSSVVRGKTQGLEKDLAKFKASPTTGEWAGFVLMLRFDDPAFLHEQMVGSYKDKFAVLGLTMPDDSVFAPYDAALRTLVDEAKTQAGNYKWSWTGHDAMIEGKARAWLAQKDPKATVVKIGMLHTDWQVDSVNGGVPKGRYKRGYVMYRKPGLQHCIVNSFSFEQSYLGNGRYNDMAVTSGMGNALRLQNCN